MSNKSIAARLSILSNSGLILMKLAVGVVTGSVSIISEAIHSTMDLIASVIAYFSIKVADRPADKDHPYGHGKAENISGIIEAGLILAAAIWIIFEAIKKLIHPGKMEHVGFGVAVMAISAVANIFVSRYLYKVAKQEDSIALEADALHLKVDVYTSAGVSLGLLIITGARIFSLSPKFDILDPVFAIGIALLILCESIDLFIKAFRPIMDNALSDDELQVIRKSIEKYLPILSGYHAVRSRKSGATRYIDFHLDLPKAMPLVKAHEICDLIEKEIEGTLHGTDIIIHAEPCSTNCPECAISGSCTYAGNQNGL